MKRVLITGVTGNLGNVCERVFSKHWHVIGLSRQSVDSGYGAELYQVDINKWSDVNPFLKSQSGFDLVIMAHGIQKPSLLADIDSQMWNDVIGGNLHSSVRLTSELMKLKKLNNGSLVVYCSSIQATQPRAGRGLYAISKAGLEALARIAAVELAPIQSRALALRLGQMKGTMRGINFDPVEEAAIKARTPLAWVDFEKTARFIWALYEQPSLTGDVIEISSGHKFSIWPDGV